MPTVETVNGPIDVEELGLTLIHEHFRTVDEAGRIRTVVPPSPDIVAHSRAVHRLIAAELTTSTSELR
jgi:predicted metal-dependent phosphotriesterase family hydrolase